MFIFVTIFGLNRLTKNNKTIYFRIIALWIFLCVVHVIQYLPPPSCTVNYCIYNEGGYYYSCSAEYKVAVDES